MMHLHSSIEGANNWKSKASEQKTFVESEKVRTWKSKVHIKIASMPLWKIDFLELSGDLGLERRETPKWMNKKIMKKLDEKSWMNNWPGYILVLYTIIQVGY
jgi:hypothetical protein